MRDETETVILVLREIRAVFGAWPHAIASAEPERPFIEMPEPVLALTCASLFDVDASTPVSVPRNTSHTIRWCRFGPAPDDQGAFKPLGDSDPFLLWQVVRLPDEGRARVLLERPRPKHPWHRLRPELDL